MSLVIAWVILGAALVNRSSAVHKHAGLQLSSCDEFSKGVAFSSNQAVNTWYLLHLRPSNDPGDARCVQFSAVSDQERKDLKERIGKYVSDLKWEKLALKMQIPCVGPSGQNNKTRDYYLEELGHNDGSYKTLQMPSPSAKLETTDFNRHAMRLKLVEGKYLAMKDCVEDFTFLLDTYPHEKLSPALENIVRTHMPTDD